MEKENIFQKIDQLIQNIDSYKVEPLFTDERNKSQDKTFAPFLNDDEMLKMFSYLIAYSQNANSKTVGQVLKSGKFDKAFNDFKIEEVIKLNPCDISDQHWKSIHGITLLAKLFQIVKMVMKNCYK